MIPSLNSARAGSAQDASIFEAAAPRDWRTRTVRWLLSLTIWGGLILLIAAQNYIVLNSNGREVTFVEMLIREYPVWLGWWLLTPFLYAFIRRFPLGRGRWRYVPLYIPAVVAFSSLYITLLAVMRYVIRSTSGVELPTFFRFWKQYQLGAFGQALPILILIIFCYYGINYVRAYQRRELRASQLEAELSRARLDVLRMQIQPHFLFNTLHSISALMETDVKAARRMISQFSELLRASLEEDKRQETTLEDEIHFLKQYLGIQRVRFQDRLSITFDIAEEALSLWVPRLLLQPLVENALKHGIAKRRGPGRVRVAANVSENMLTLVVEDNGPGFGDGAVIEGVGLRNTRERLSKLYGAQASYHVETEDSSGGRITVHIPVHNEAKTSEI